ncbi:MAG: carboxypeptidase regulatory-like domain-containing protein [Planctomycetes bacterium]|nr:carboxypeptidase regulatory-like domain-containing protein [Planctomycetota bacterium]
MKEAPPPGEGEAGGFPGDMGSGPSGNKSYETAADENGHYAIHGILPGRYLAMVQRPAKEGSSGHGMQVSIGDEAGDSGESVTIDEGKTTTRDLHLAPTGAVAGQVSAAGMPLPGVSVWLNWKQEPNLTLFGGARDRTGEDGEFLLEDVKPGQYLLSVAAKGAARPIRREVEVRPRQTARETIVLPTGIISGRIKDVDSGHGIPGVVITVRPAREDAEEETGYSTTTVVTSHGDGRSSWMTFGDAPEVLATDENGCYDVCFLDPGDYRVEVQGGGIVKMRKDQVHVFEGQRTDGVDFEATIGAVLMVRPQLDAGDEPPGLFDATLTNETTGQKDTRFAHRQPFLRFDGISPGRYTVRLSAGERSGEMLVEIASGEQKDVAVPLR